VAVPGPTTRQQAAGLDPMSRAREATPDPEAIVHLPHRASAAPGDRTRLPREASIRERVRPGNPRPATEARLRRAALRGPQSPADRTVAAACEAAAEPPVALRLEVEVLHRGEAVEEIRQFLS
jgi:hypothetical protein